MTATRTQPPPDEPDDPLHDRALPHNLEAERSILGAVLMDNTAWELAAEMLKPPHFYRDAPGDCAHTPRCKSEQEHTRRRAADLRR